MALSKLTCATREEFQRSSKSIHEIDAWMLLQFNLSWLWDPMDAVSSTICQIDQTSFDLCIVCIARPRHGGNILVHSKTGQAVNSPLSAMTTQLSWRSTGFGFLGDPAAIWAAASARCVSLCSVSLQCAAVWHEVRWLLQWLALLRYSGMVTMVELLRRNKHIETQSFKMNSHHRVSLIHFLCRAVPLEFALIAALSDGSFCLSHGGNIWYFP